MYCHIVRRIFALYLFRGGGLGVHVIELAAGLQRRGHELHVLTRSKEDQNYYDTLMASIIIASIMA